MLDKTGDGMERALRTQGMAVGEVVEMSSASMRVSMRAGTTVIAQGQELVGQIESIRHRVEGAVAGGGLSLLARGASYFGQEELARNLQDKADHARSANQHEAAEAARQAHADAGVTRAWGQRQADTIEHNGQWMAGKLRNGYASAGAYVDSGYDLAASRVKGVTSYAPVALATVGAVTAGLGRTVDTHLPASGNIPMTLENLRNLTQSARVVQRLGPSFTEATGRHGMDETVIPSLDAELIKQEAEARKLIEQHQRSQHSNEDKKVGVASAVTALVLGINDPSHPDYHLFKGAQAGVHGIDAQYNHRSDLYSDQLAGALAAKAKQEGLQCVERVVLSKDCARVYAVEVEGFSVVRQKFADVEVAQGRQQPLSVSAEQVAEVSRQQAQAELSRPLVADMETQRREQQQMARGMG